MVKKSGKDFGNFLKKVGKAIGKGAKSAHKTLNKAYKERQQARAAQKKPAVTPVKPVSTQPATSAKPVAVTPK